MFSRPLSPPNAMLAKQLQRMGRNDTDSRVNLQWARGFCIAFGGRRHWLEVAALVFLPQAFIRALLASLLNQLATRRRREKKV